MTKKSLSHRKEMYKAFQDKKVDSLGRPIAIWLKHKTKTNFLNSSITRWETAMDFLTFNIEVDNILEHLTINHLLNFKEL